MYIPGTDEAGTDTSAYDEVEFNLSQDQEEMAKLITPSKNSISGNDIIAYSFQCQDFLWRCYILQGSPLDCETLGGNQGQQPLRSRPWRGIVGGEAPQISLVRTDRSREIA